MFPSQHKSKAASFLIAAGLLAGCCVPAGAQTVGGTQRAALITNGQKYSDKGSKPATGRAGSATVRARALLAKDGTTDVEVTTGALDDAATPPGQLARVQLKTLNQGGEAVYTKNFGGLAAGGYFKTTLDDVRRGQPLQTQATVRGIDPNRTGVVTMLTNVSLRPDLRATSLTAPARALRGSPVNITATVDEANHDVGANARCVLYVDGAQADSAQGIWVDAGDTVSCAFSRIFGETGTRRLRVSVEEVVPGDYDPSNNSAEASIDITDDTGGSAVPANHSAYVGEFFHDRSYVAESYWRTDDGTYLEEYDYGQNYRYAERRQNVNMVLTVRKVLAFPFNVSVKEFNDGVEVLSTSFAGVGVDTVYHDPWLGLTYRNASRYDAATGVSIYFFSLDPSPAGSAEYDNSVTQMVYYRHAGKVTYYSAYFQRYWYNYDGSEYHYSYNYSSAGEEVSGGAMTPPFGSEYKLESSFGTVGDPTTYVASPVVSLESSVYVPHDSPYSCDEYAFYPYFQRYCYGGREEYAQKVGFVYSYGN